MLFSLFVLAVIVVLLLSQVLTLSGAGLFQNPYRSACLCLLSGGIKGVCHHTQLTIFFKEVCQKYKRVVAQIPQVYAREVAQSVKHCVRVTAKLRSLGLT